jgi:hypothetical protein
MTRNQSMTYTCLYPHRSTRGYCRCYQRCRNARNKGKKKEYSKGCMRNSIRFPFHTTPIAMILPYSSSISSFTRNYPTNPWTRTSYGLLRIIQHGEQYQWHYSLYVESFLILRISKNEYLSKAQLPWFGINCRP